MKIDGSVEAVDVVPCGHLDDYYPSTTDDGSIEAELLVGPVDELSPEHGRDPLPERHACRRTSFPHRTTTAMPIAAADAATSATPIARR